MMRDGIEYGHMPDKVDLNMVHTVETPFSSGVSKLTLAHQLIEQVHKEAQAYGAEIVWMGGLSFRQLDGTDGIQAYTCVCYFNDRQADAA